MSAIIICPKCQSQLEIKAQFASGPKSATPDPAGRLKELLDQINDDDLAGGMAKFVTEIRERFEQYGSRTKISEKQLAWLERIADGETGKDDF